MRTTTSREMREIYWITGTKRVSSGSNCRVSRINKTLLDAALAKGMARFTKKPVGATFLQIECGETRGSRVCRGHLRHPFAPSMPRQKQGEYLSAVIRAPCKN